MDVTIIPEPGQQVAIAKLLLRLADNASQVRYVSHPAAGFQVPEEVFSKFEAAYGDKTSDVTSVSTEDTTVSAVDTPVTADVPAPKRRGRPRKQQGEEK